MVHSFFLLDWENYIWLYHLKCKICIVQHGIQHALFLRLRQLCSILSLQVLDLFTIFLGLHKASKEWIKKLGNLYPMICKIYTTTTMKLRDITSPRWGYLIWFDQILGPHGVDFDQTFSWKVKCPTYACSPLPSGLTLIDALVFAWIHKTCQDWKRSG